jgi:hypothetical protein
VNILKGLSAKAEAEIVIAEGQHSTKTHKCSACGSQSRSNEFSLGNRPPRLANSAAEVSTKPTNCQPPAVAKLELEVMSGGSLRNKPPRQVLFLHPYEQQRCRLKASLLPHVSPPRNPKVAPATKKHKNVDSQIGSGKGQKQPESQIPRRLDFAPGSQASGGSAKIHFSKKKSHAPDTLSFLNKNSQISRKTCMGARLLSRPRASGMLTQGQGNGSGPRGRCPIGYWIVGSWDKETMGRAGSRAEHQWSSGRIHRCHRCDPGSIPG